MSKIKERVGKLTAGKGKKKVTVRLSEDLMRYYEERFTSLTDGVQTAAEEFRNIMTEQFAALKGRFTEEEFKLILRACRYERDARKFRTAFINVVSSDVVHLMVNTSQIDAYLDKVKDLTQAEGICLAMWANSLWSKFSTENEIPPLDYRNFLEVMSE